MILGFEYFHPLNGSHPDTFPEYGADIIVRARDLIKNRTVSELHSIINLINWLIDNSLVQEEAENRLLQMAEEIDRNVEADEECNTEEIHLNRDIDTSTYAVKAFQAKFELPSIDEVPNLLWSEIFALLALSLVDKTIDDEQYYKSWKHDDADWMYEWRILSHASYWLIEAMDAVSTAEGFRKVDAQESAAKEKISLRNTAAAIQRHAKTNAAVLALEKLISEGKYKSMRNAAQIFCEKFPEKVSHLAAYNNVRTLCDALSNHQKGQRRSMLDN
jgi:hypothetical protein